MIDLSTSIFSTPFVRPCTYTSGGVAIPMPSGCIFDRKMDAGRPGVAGEFRPELRQGAGNHATIYIRMADLDGRRPKINDEITICSQDGKDETYRVRSVSGPEGAIFSLICEKKGTRLVSSEKGGSGGMSRVY